MIKLAISGKKNTGKNTVVSLIENTLVKPHLFIHSYAFADPIKEIARQMFPQIDNENLWGPSEKRNTIIPDAFDEDGNPLTCRKLLLDIGKNGRKYNPDIWINATFDFLNIHAKDSYAQIISTQIISDVRFKNEFKRCKKENFILIRIVRPKNESINQDISEIDLDDITDSEFDFVISNDGNLSDLEKKVNQLIEKIFNLKIS